MPISSIAPWTVHPARFGALLTLIAGLSAAALPPAAQAQTPNESLADNVLDQPDADLVDDICDADPSPAVRCTLRAAVMQANVSPGEHVIRLRPVLYRLTIPGAGEDQSVTGDLDLVGKISIIGTNGGGRARAIVDGTGLNDQRGSFRFAEFRPGGNRFDMGAVESNAFGVGEFEVTAPTTAAAEELVVLNATWVHPERWRDLNTVEVQLRSDEALGLRVAFTEGVSTVGGVEVTDGLTLYDSDGTVAGVGVPGEDAVLESDTALLDLGASSLEGSGPTGASVRLVLAVRLKANAAGRVYTTTLLASDDEGMIQGPHEIGTLTVDAPQ